MRLYYNLNHIFHACICFIIIIIICLFIEVQGYIRLFKKIETALLINKHMVAMFLAYTLFTQKHLRHRNKDRREV